MALIEVTAELAGGAEIDARSGLRMGLTAAIKREKPSTGFAPAPKTRDADEVLLHPGGKP